MPPDLGRLDPRQARLDALPVLKLQRLAGNRAVTGLLGADGDRPVVMRAPSTEDCDVDTEQTILTSHFAAARFLRAAITATEPTLAALDETVADAVKHWFNIDREDASRAFENGRDYIRARKALRSVDGPKDDASYECSAATCWILGDPNAAALGDIVVCDDWFTYTDDVRAKILVHEWTHKWGDGVSRAIETYEDKNDADWTGMSSSERVTMPDAYEGFAREMATGTR